MREQHRNQAPVTDNGYVLITAIWLLLLAAAVLALIVTQNARSDSNARFEKRIVARQMALESGLSTAIFDAATVLSLDKPLSLPMVRRYTISGIDMTVVFRDENGKLDVNRSDPELIRRAMQGLAVSSDIAVNFTQRIAEKRLVDRKIVSLEDIDQELAIAGLDRSNSGFCARRYFTVFASSGQPNPKSMRAELARALAIPISTDDQPTDVATIFAVEVKPRNGAPLYARVFLRGGGAKMFELLHSHHARECGI